MADRNLTNKEYADELRGCFLKKGAEALSDTELLCLLLSFSNVKADLAEVSNALIERFQTPNNCYLASYSDLIDIVGMTRHAAILLMLMGKLAVYRDIESAHAESEKECEKQFLALLRYTTREELWAAALDEDGTVLELECLSFGDDMNVEISTGALMRFAVKTGAKSIIIAHAHPHSTELVESPTDVYSRKHLAAALSAAGVALKGQIIVAGGMAKMYHMDETN